MGCFLWEWDTHVNRNVHNLQVYMLNKYCRFSRRREGQSAVRHAAGIKGFTSEALPVTCLAVIICDGWERRVIVYRISECVLRRKRIESAKLCVFHGTFLFVGKQCSESVNTCRGHSNQNETLALFLKTYQVLENRKRLRCLKKHNESNMRRWISKYKVRSRLA